MNDWIRFSILHVGIVLKNKPKEEYGLIMDIFVANLLKTQHNIKEGKVKKTILIKVSFTIKVLFLITNLITYVNLVVWYMVLKSYDF